MLHVVSEADHSENSGDAETGHCVKHEFAWVGGGRRPGEVRLEEAAA